MGKTMSSMPETWAGLLEERDRVLHWSSEVLAKVQDNIKNEDLFLLDYSDDRIDAKIDTWMKTSRMQIDEMFNRLSNTSDQLRNFINVEVEKLNKEIRAKMKKDYLNAYNDIAKFNKKVDQLGADEQKIHTEIEALAAENATDMPKNFQKKFGQLRMKVFENLRLGEKMILQIRKLKSDYVKKIYNIDYKNSSEYVKRVNKLLKDFEKKATKERI